MLYKGIKIRKDQHKYEQICLFGFFDNFDVTAHKIVYWGNWILLQNKKFESENFKFRVTFLKIIWYLKKLSDFHLFIVTIIRKISNFFLYSDIIKIKWHHLKILKLDKIIQKVTIKYSKLELLSDQKNKIM